jgi:hypothetical protein
MYIKQAQVNDDATFCTDITAGPTGSLWVPQCGVSYYTTGGNLPTHWFQAQNLEDCRDQCDEKVGCAIFSYNQQLNGGNNCFWLETTSLDPTNPPPSYGDINQDSGYWVGSYNTSYWQIIQDSQDSKYSVGNYNGTKWWHGLSPSDRGS